ncbi:MAG: hypothetical protein ABEJ87_03820, partial [Candidatus Nanohalobium sp.]
MPTCDICGEEFDTERGLHIHESQKHGDEADAQEDSAEEETAEEESGTEEAETGEEEEVVREIEEETEGGLLGGFSRESLVVGGVLIGVALGLALGLYLANSGNLGASSFTANPGNVRQSIESLPGAQLNVTSVTRSNGVYQVNATRPMSFGNRTVARQLQLYVSPDGKILFLKGTKFDKLRAQLQAQRQ